MMERRLRERIPFELEVEIHREGGWVKIEKTRDLSMGGIQINTTEDIPSGEKVLLRLRLADSAEFLPLQVDGVVVRTEIHADQKFVGVRFEGLGSDESLFLYRLIQFHKA